MQRDVNGVPRARRWQVGDSGGLTTRGGTRGDEDGKRGRAMERRARFACVLKFHYRGEMRVSARERFIKRDIFLLHFYLALTRPAVGECLPASPPDSAPPSSPSNCRLSPVDSRSMKGAIP